MNRTMHQLLDILDDSIQCASNVNQPDNCDELHFIYNDLESAIYQKRINDLEPLLFKAIDLIDKAKSRLHEEVTLGTVFVEVSKDLAEAKATWDDLTYCLEYHIKQVLKGRAELLVR